MIDIKLSVEEAVELDNLLNAVSTFKDFTPVQVRLELITGAIKAKNCLAIQTKVIEKLNL